MEKNYGWAGQRPKVYLSEGRVVKEPTPEDLKREYIGARGFNSKVLFDEVGPSVDPLSPENVLIFGVGPLTGTAAPASGRWTVTAKSPLTGIFSDGYGGGDVAAELKFAGYDQIIFYGRSPKPVYLLINNDRVELRDASHLWGKTTWETHNLLVRELGDREVREFAIGPAGENLVRFANILANTTRAGGKCGMGAVMGSKNLKAVAVRGTGSVKIARPDEFYKSIRRVNEMLMASQHHRGFKEHGTLSLTRFYNMTRSLPTRNAQEGCFEGWEKLTQEAFESQFAVKHTGCFSCPLSCSHYYRVKGGPYATHGRSNQFGTLYPFTARCGSDNFAASLLLTTLCDKLGIDTHGCGCTISFAMEAWQRGLLTAADTDGIDLRWGNIDGIIQLVRKIAYREGFGNVLADGSRMASKSIKGSEVCLTETKGEECSSFYPGEGEFKIEALAFATAPVGGSIHRGAFIGLQGHPRVKKALDDKTLKNLHDPQAYEGQGVVLALENDFVAALDSTESCLLLCMYGPTEDDLAATLSAGTGLDIDGAGLMKAGERIFNVEKCYNVRQGLRRKDDTLPNKFFVEKTTEWGITGLNRAKFEAMLDEYYSFRGWDSEGIPTKKKLSELNLDYVAKQIGAA